MLSAGQSPLVAKPRTLPAATPRGRFGRFWDITGKVVGNRWNYSQVMGHAGPADLESLHVVMTKAGANGGILHTCVKVLQRHSCSINGWFQIESDYRLSLRFAPLDNELYHHFRVLGHMRGLIEYQFKQALDDLGFCNL
jgi:hypothetical protein